MFVRKYVIELVEVGFNLVRADDLRATLINCLVFFGKYVEQLNYFP